MYNLLIVDDEPLICKGLRSLLQESDLDIDEIYCANSGQEALDYFRLEEIDVLITDIQMGTMSGIDLMYQAKLLKPWIQTIIISAHETFQYAQQAIRLGAKDYLIKPINNDQLLDSVRSVLLKLDKVIPLDDLREDDEVISMLKKDFIMREPNSESTHIITSILNQESEASIVEGQLDILAKQFDIELRGPYYAVMKVKILLDKPESSKGILTHHDEELIWYAVLNVVNEAVDQELNHLSFQQNDDITVIVQWSEEDYQGGKKNRIDQLESVGRFIHSAVARYLHIDCVIGFSQIVKGIDHLPNVNQQAQKSIAWNKGNYDHAVYYYGDLNWSIYDEDPTVDDINEHNNSIVEKVKSYIDENYSQKGLTLHEIAQKNHVSPNYLSYLFKKFTDFNLWEYVIKLRMEESKRLILTTDKRRYEIADLVGYESPEHFSKIFKKYYGVSPSDLKK